MAVVLSDDSYTAISEKVCSGGSASDCCALSEPANCFMCGPLSAHEMATNRKETFMAQVEQPKQPDRRKTNVDPTAPPQPPDGGGATEVRETQQREHSERPERDATETHDPAHPGEPDARIGTHQSIN